MTVNTRNTDGDVPVVSDALPSEWLPDIASHEIGTRDPPSRVRRVTGKGTRNNYDCPQLYDCEMGNESRGTDDCLI